MLAAAVYNKFYYNTLNCSQNIYFFNIDNKDVDENEKIYTDGSDGDDDVNIDTLLFTLLNALLFSHEIKGFINRNSHVLYFAGKYGPNVFHKVKKLLHNIAKKVKRGKGNGCTDKIKIKLTYTSHNNESGTDAIS